ncbi:MAG TPA: hypothetical protein VM778_10605 [Gemmatimonadota bacterium]|nr:hypothetical protein [Gemmatimonadota bacterium]
MAEPVIIVRENGLVVEVDLGNERCNVPSVSPSTGQHQKYEIRWSDADFKPGDWEVTKRPGPGGEELAILRWKPKGGAPPANC